MTAAVIASCADHYGLLVGDMLGPCRERRFVLARRAAAYVLRVHHGLSYPAIALALGGMHHTSAIYACRVAPDWLARDQDGAALVSALLAVPRSHRDIVRVARSPEKQLDIKFPAKPIPVRRRAEMPGFVARSPGHRKNRRCPDDFDALAREIGSLRLAEALARAGYA